MLSLYKARVFLGRQGLFFFGRGSELQFAFLTSQVAKLGIEGFRISEKAP